MNPGKRAALLAAAATALTLFALGSGSAAAQQSENPCDQLVGNEELGPAGDIGPAGGELRPLCAIEVKKNVVTDKVQVGSTISFNIIITNVGTLPLTGVSLIDVWEETMLDFEGATVSPFLHDEEADTEQPGGVAVWDELLPSPDGGLPGLWDSGESLTLTVTFETEQGGVDENCAFVGAQVPESQLEPDNDERQTSCDSFEVISPTPRPTNTQTSGGGGGGGRSQRPTSTPTDTPNTPVPVSTVAPATVVPPVRTVAPVGISAPDTGTGDGLNASNQTEVLLFILAGVVGVSGSVMLRRSLQ